MSKDADFSDRVLASAAGPKVIHIRVGNLIMANLHHYLSRIWGDVCRTSESFRLVQVFRDRIEAID